MNIVTEVLRNNFSEGFSKRILKNVAEVLRKISLRIFFLRILRKYAVYNRY